MNSSRTMTKATVTAEFLILVCQSRLICISLYPHYIKHINIHTHKAKIIVKGKFLGVNTDFMVITRVSPDSEIAMTDWYLSEQFADCSRAL